MKPTAVILAGGQGTRFVPFSTNKTMWPICGKLALEHTLDMVRSAGIERIIVVANKQNEKYLQTYQSTSPNLVYRLQDEALGMYDALYSIADLIGKTPIIVLNSIDFIEINLIKNVLARIEKEHPHLLVCGMKVGKYVPSMGYYELKNGKVTGVVEKPAEGNQPSDVIRLVFDYFADPAEYIALFETFTDPSDRDQRYENAQDVLLKKYGADIEYSSYWSKLKFPFNVLDVMNTMFDHRIEKFVHPTAQVAPLAVVEGKVYIDEGARIEAYAVIKGPAYIGRNALIGNHTLVRQSTIEADATVGFGTEVARSYVGPGCQLHHTFVGDSVLEKDVNMSWGTVTTNLRLDRKPVRCKLPDGSYVPTGKDKLGALIAQGSFLGSNASTMPGVCIPAQTNIHPGSVVK
ncbi:NTP transferase domain-containing protein [Candidatus Woesebacteria bacterium]|nr:NTP transferase domain-containing protein [Candidatus Woesebacteria bacterium]